MPNRYGFNLLGPEVACIVCDVRGPKHEWPDAKMQAHNEAHLKEAIAFKEKMARKRARDARKLARQKERENAMAYGGSDEA